MHVRFVFKFSVQSKIFSFAVIFLLLFGDDSPWVAVSDEAWRELPGETSKIKTLKITSICSTYRQNNGIEKLNFVEQIEKFF